MMIFHAPKLPQKQTTFFSIPIPAGAARAAEQIVEWISLDEYVRNGLEDIFYLRTFGDSMQEAGVYHGDLLVVRRTETARSGDVVIADINGEFTVKRLKDYRHKLCLVPANSNYSEREITTNDYFAILGIVTYIIHKV